MTMSISMSAELRYGFIHIHSATTTNTCYDYGFANSYASEDSHWQFLHEHDRYQPLPLLVLKL